MKRFFAILFLIPTVCVACEVRPTSSGTPTNNKSVPSPSPTQIGTDTVSDAAPCSLVLDQSPVTSGLKLGMTSGDVLALFPGSREDAEVSTFLARPANQFGVSSFLIRPEKYESKEKFAGISQITFTLLDDRVSRFYIGYNGPAWPHVDKFVAKFVEGTNLPPPDGWEPYVGLDSMKTLKCKDFDIQIFAGGKGGNLNYVIMNDLGAAQKLKEREDKAAAKATP